MRKTHQVYDWSTRNSYTWAHFRRESHFRRTRGPVFVENGVFAVLMGADSYTWVLFRNVFEPESRVLRARRGQARSTRTRGPVFVAFSDPKARCCAPNADGRIRFVHVGSFSQLSCACQLSKIANALDAKQLRNRLKKRVRYNGLVTKLKR